MLCWPCDTDCLSMWLDCAFVIIDLKACHNYRTFLVEWWIPMSSKKEPKILVPL